MSSGLTLAELNVQIGGRLDKLEAALAQATAQVERYGRSTATRIQTLNQQLANEAKKTGAAVGSTFDGAGQSVQGLGKKLDQVGGQAAQAGAQAESAFAMAERSAQSLGTTLSTVGSKLTMTLTVPIMLAAGEATKLSIDFGDAMAKIEGAAGAGAQEVARLRTEVLSLSGEVAKAPRELADALYYIESMGFRGAEALDILRRSAQLSAAGLGTTADIASTVKFAINAYGKENLDAARAADILAAAVREGGAAPDAIAGAIGRVLPEAARLHVSFDQLAGSIAAMTRIGLNVPEAVTAIRATFLQLDHPSKQTREALAEVGLTAEGVSKALSQDLLGTLSALAKASENSGEAFARMFPNVRAFTGVLALTGENAEHVRGIMDRMRNSVGSADEIFKVASKTAGHELRQAFASLQAAAIDLGDKAGPSIRLVAEDVKGAADAFGRLDPAVQKLVLEVGLGLAALGPFASGLGSIIHTATLAKSTISGLAEAFAGLRAAQTAAAIGGAGASVAAGGAVAAEVGAVAAAEGAATAGAVGLTAALAPVAIGLAAVAAAAYGLKVAYDAVSGPTLTQLDAQVRKEIENQKASAQAKADAYKEAFRLAASYEILSDKSNKTTKDQELLRDIMDRIGKLAPELVTGYDNQGRAIIDMAGKASELAKRLTEAANAARLLAGQQIANDMQEAAERRAIALDKMRAVTTDEAKVIPEFMAQGVDEAKRQFNQADAQYKALKERLRETLKPPVDIPVRRAVNLGGGGGGGGDEGSGSKRISDIERQLEELREKAYEAQRAMDLGDNASEHARLWYDGWHGRIEGVRAELLKIPFSSLEIPIIKGPNAQAWKHTVNLMAAQEAFDQARKEATEAGRDIASAMVSSIDHALADDAELTKAAEERVKAYMQAVTQATTTALNRVRSLNREIALFGDSSRYAAELYDIKSQPAPAVADPIGLAVIASLAAMRLAQAKRLDQLGEEKKLEDEITATFEEAGRAIGSTLKAMNDEQDRYNTALRESNDRIEELNGLTREQKAIRDLTRQYPMISDDDIRKLVNLKLYSEDLEAWERKVEEVAGKVADVMVKAAGEMVSGAFQPAFNATLDGFRQMLSQMVLEWAKAQAQLVIKNAILGDGSGGLLGALGSVIGMQAPTSPIGVGVGQDIGSIVNGALADGGPTFGGKAYLVGERGPELFVPNSAGTVVPSIQGAGTTVNVHFHADPRTGGLNLTESQIAIAVQRGLERARRSGLG